MTQAHSTCNETASGASGMAERDPGDEDDGARRLPVVRPGAACPHVLYDARCTVAPEAK